MKKLLAILLVALLFAGCGGEQSLETITDVPDTPVVSTTQKILVQLPSELSTPALQNADNGTLYLCEDYSVVVQTLAGGDLAKTIQGVTGMKKEDLQIIQTLQGDSKCYQWVWTVNGEKGVQIGRGCILDDGAYHYVLTALVDEELGKKVQPVWKEIFASFRLTSDEVQINTGS